VIWSNFEHETHPDGEGGKAAFAKDIILIAKSFFRLADMAL
jgi:hypothetical protein